MSRKRAKKYVGFKRGDRLASEVQRVVSLAIAQEMDDPRLAGVSVTDVEMNADNSIAKVYFSTLGGPERVQEAEKGLRAGAGFLRHKVGQAVRLVTTPELRFYFDASLENAAHMNELFEKIHAEHPADDDTDDEGEEIHDAPSAEDRRS
ncbi:MAG: 30S ribosome-binding factor RbfA [Deltaproteobacteria bacterium]|nr:30S ribosome-binding factor RbfA [bacterium]MCB9477188.1 30S ribosome-binding factor RbfA [Deltaproteobacteria bacterium]MCB9479066.1 30S ribosome-binding factor RbfA [Deltaproteobacteria bacterium]MCB9488128.1 30S ribosome-binding factor RbfA [Deltaproteobacteria bacterium]